MTQERDWSLYLRAAAGTAAWWDRYADYLDSPAWAERRAAALDRAGGWCEHCHWERATHVHHRHYRSAGAERLRDLMALCRDCHEARHPHMVEPSMTFAERWAQAGHR